jgi:hypothetical protein
MAMHPRIRRLLRVVGIVTGIVLGLAIIAALSLLIRPLREVALHNALSIASDSLPGTIDYERATWPGLSRLELHAVSWRNGEDLLAASERILVDVDLVALTRKDLHVRALVLDGVEVDVPGIQAALGSDPGPESDPGDDGDAGFPREGALPGIPSVAVDSLRLGLVRLDATEDVSVRLSLAMALDVLAERAPLISIGSLDGTWIQREWTVQSDGLNAAIASGELSGGLGAELGEQLGLELALESDGPRRFRMLLRERGEDSPVLKLDGEFTQRANGMVETVDYRLELRAPEIARIESLLEKPGALESIEPFGQILVGAEGELSLPDEVRSETTIEVTASDWEGRIDARLRQVGPRLELDELTLRGEGLSVAAAGAYDADGYSADVEAELSGIEFLARMMTVEDVPEDLRAQLKLELSGTDDELRSSLQVNGSARSAGLDSLRLEAFGTVAGKDSDLRFGLRAAVREQLAIGVDARVRDLEEPAVYLAPIRVRQSMDRIDEASGSIPDTPNLRLEPRERRVVFDGLRVTGGLGELRLEGDVSDSLGGWGRLAVDWPVPPAALGLIGFDKAARDSLLAPHWSSDGVPGIEAYVELPSGTRAGQVDASIALPAPWTLIAGLDSAAYRAPQLRGTAVAELNRSGTWKAALDFAETAWLDSAFVHAHGIEGVTHLDSMLVRGGPIRATAAAELDSAQVEGKFQLEVHSHPAVAMVVPELPLDLEFMLNLRAGVAGSVDAPDARAKLLATARSPDVRLPLLSVEAELAAGVPQFARLEVPERARVGGFRIEQALIAAQPENPEEGLFPLWIAGELDGDARWSQTAVIDSVGATWRVVTDSLQVGAGGHVLESLRQFTLEIAPADSTFRLEGLELAGEPGRISASVDLRPGRAQADVDAHVDGSILGALVRTPESMLPTGYHLVASGNQDDLTASVWIEGITLGMRRDIVARIDSKRVGDQVEIQVGAVDPLGRLADGNVTLPMRADLVNRRFEWYDGPLTGTVVVDSLPLPYKIGGDQGLSSYLLGARDEEAPLGDAKLLLGGTGHQPVVGARIGAGFPQIKELQDDRLQLGALWIGREGDPASLNLFEPDMLETLRRALPHGGITVGGTLKRGQRELATLRAAFPLAEDTTSPFPGFGDEDPMLFAVSAEPLRLDEWQAMMPRGTEVGGELWVNATGDGPIGDFPLEASVRMKELRFRQSFGNSATLDGQIEVSGRSSAPVIRGALKVPSALVRLPESERDLHPVSGDSKLWNLGLEPRDEFAMLDSLEVEWGWAFDVEDTVEVYEPGLTLAESTELDVNIEIPNSFWIRGQGLEVQLAGELHLELRNGVPIVVGELRALSGQLEIVGARLRLDRGVVTFFGGDTTNTALDLELSRDAGDVKVIVRVTGTAQEPRLAFDSDPPMSQSDIMSYLIFGSSATDLDGAQTQLLQDQTAAALSQFAAPMLENELTQSLGISMMQLRAGENPDEGLSLVVGKYVTPQILLKYEQSLKDRQKYTVNAEYWLTRNLRIETRLSQAHSTGIELNWSTDY